ncbi:CAP domain-containing protein [Cellulomonas fimi]|uniref:CAP domain-containing protein n=1 Tax=Cellulomonas fimi TaxID=1708 RepID=A0A7Y0QI30_CELFI|nr:CAP domain-containing protein [Cellulomonas fimi]NMR20489.1 CAP domain-containing protein [Cellulomonas fimi]
MAHPRQVTRAPAAGRAHPDAAPDAPPSTRVLPAASRPGAVPTQRPGAVPTQRSGAMDDDVARVPGVPTSAGAAGTVAGQAREPGLEGRGGAVRRRLVVSVVAGALVLGGTGGAIAVVQDGARTAELARQARAAEAVARTEAAAFAGEQELLRRQNSAASWAVTLAERNQALTGAAAAIEAASGVLAASPHASPEALAVLQTAIESASAVVAAEPTPPVRAIEASVAALAAPQQAVAEAEAAWQAAEAARVEAERVEAERVEAERVAAERAAATATRSRPTTSRAPRATSSGASAAPAPARAPSASVPEFSAGALGNAINAYRESRGLPALSISRSGALVAHAEDMALAGSIWHSGSDNIVGYVQPSSAASLVQAWANSPSHDAQMLRRDVSSMRVGATVLDNRLYAAVGFG